MGTAARAKQEKAATDAPPSRWVALVDASCRAAFVIAYRMARAWWFVRRPLRHGAYVAVWWGDALLLIRNSYKRGDTVPCGGIGSSESPLEAARRELAEEVGIEVETERLSGADVIAVENDFAHEQAHFFELRLESPPPLRIDRREVVWAEFVHRDELADRSLVAAVREYVRRTLA